MLQFLCSCCLKLCWPWLTVMWHTWFYKCGDIFLVFLSYFQCLLLSRYLCGACWWFEMINSPNSTVCIDFTSFPVCWGEEPLAAICRWGWPGLTVLTEGQVGQTGACHGEPPAHDQRPGDINSQSTCHSHPNCSSVSLCCCFFVLFHFTFLVFPLGGSDAK